jgi:hypothetical protein
VNPKMCSCALFTPKVSNFFCARVRESYVPFAQKEHKSTSRRRGILRHFSD